MATTTTDDGFHEIQLNGKQLVFLFMAVTVVSVVIFLCGVLVGRGVRGERALQAADASAIGDTVDAAPPIPTTPNGGASATAKETLTYSKQLDAATPSDTLGAEKSARSTPPPEPTPPAAKAPAPPEIPPAKPAPVEKTPEPPPAAAPAATAQASAEPTGPGFAIQVAALRERSEADAVVRRLSGKGYAAYVVAPQTGTAAVYRVRVGKFKERREADTVAARLQKEEQFKPWIVR